MRQLGKLGADGRLDPAKPDGPIGAIDVHASRPAAEANAAAFTTEPQQMLGSTGLAAHPQQSVLQTAAFQVILELALDIRRQVPALRRQMGGKYRLVLFDNPVEKGLLDLVALVTASIPIPGGTPCPQRNIV